MGKLCKGGVTAVFCTPTGIEVKRRTDPVLNPGQASAPKTMEMYNSVLNWHDLFSHKGSQEWWAVELEFLTPLHFQSSQDLNIPSALSVQTVLSSLAINSLLLLQVQRVCLSMLKIKFRLLFLDMCDLWECLPGTNWFLLFFFLLKTSVLKCAYIPILGFFTFILGMGKKEEGTEHDKTWQWEEAESLSTHRLTDWLGYGSHSFFNLFFNWSVKTVMLWRTQAERDFVQHTWGQMQAQWWCRLQWLGCLTMTGGSPQLSEPHRNHHAFSLNHEPEDGERISHHPFCSWTLHQLVWKTPVPWAGEDTVQRDLEMSWTVRRQDLVRDGSVCTVGKSRIKYSFSCERGFWLACFLSLISAIMAIDRIVFLLVPGHQPISLLMCTTNCKIQAEHMERVNWTLQMWLQSEIHALFIFDG